jgi:hypothetical protein
VEPLTASDYSNRYGENAAFCSQPDAEQRAAISSPFKRRIVCARIRDRAETLAVPDSKAVQPAFEHQAFEA